MSVCDVYVSSCCWLDGSYRAVLRRCTWLRATAITESPNCWLSTAPTSTSSPRFTTCSRLVTYYSSTDACKANYRPVFIDEINYCQCVSCDCCFNKSVFILHARRSFCLFVCLSVHSHISKTTPPNFSQFSVRVTCGRDSVLLRRQRDLLRTSGFVDDVMFSRNRANVQNQTRRVCFIDFAKWQYQGEVCHLRLHLVSFCYGSVR